MPMSSFGVKMGPSTSRAEMIGFYDVIVAAAAMERGSELATFNKRHFAQVKGLSVIEPK
jgi:predicted nucleic acid-binding protein